MSDDISWCMDAKQKKCKLYKCERHPNNIQVRWKDHSYVHFYDTDYCKLKKEEVEG